MRRGKRANHKQREFHTVGDSPQFAAGSFNYLAPAASGRLIALGRQIKMGKTLGYAAAEVRSEDGRLLAHGTSTVIVLPVKLLAADPPLPPKFI